MFKLKTPSSYWMALIGMAIALMAVACSSQPAAAPVIDPDELRLLIQSTIEESIPTIDPVSPAEIQKMVENAVSGSTPSGVSADEIKLLVGQAVAAAAPAGASPGEIQAMVQKAVTAASKSSAAEMQTLVSKAVTDASETGLTAEQVESIVGSALDEQAASGPKPTLIMADNQFESLWINNAIFKYVVENGYGYPVESIPTTTPIAQLSLSNGDVDVWLELWQQNWIDNYREITADGSIVNMGMIYEGGPQFWIIPQSVSDEHNIKTIDDLKANWQLFEDPEDPTKGAFINCPAGWQCAEINRTKVAAYGLDETFNVVEPGGPAALAAGLTGPALRGDPVFGYYWAPTALMGRFDWQIIEEPTYTDECWAEVAIGQNDKDYVPAEACAYETLPIDKGINRDMLKKAPDVVQMMNRMNVGLQPINVTAAWAIEADIQGEWEKAAIYYLENYEERWTSWMPADNADLVKAALAAEGS